MSQHLVHLSFILLLIIVPHSLNAITFVVTRLNAVCRKSKNVTRSLHIDLNASISDLQVALRTVAESCNISSDFDPLFLGKSIVSTSLSTNDTIATIPGMLSLAMNLHEIWGDGFRIPLQLRVRSHTPESDVFKSLEKLFQGFSGSNLERYGWYRFIMKTIEMESCSVQSLCQLCYRFEKHFICKGRELIFIKLDTFRLEGILDLGSLPDSVQGITVERNSLTKIVGFDQLERKQLRYLNIRRNPLDLNLYELNTSPARNPLKDLRVNKCQVSHCMLGIPRHMYTGSLQLYYNRRLLCAVQRWIDSSTIETLKFATGKQDQNRDLKQLCVVRNRLLTTETLE